MRPIDVIKRQIDNDLFKYQHTINCRILDFVFIRGVGLILKARPYIADKQLISVKEKETSGIDDIYFNVICVNRPYGWIDREIKEKYNVLVITVMSDSPSLCPGILVPQTILDFNTLWETVREEKIPSELKASAEHNLDVSSGEK